MQIRPLHRHYSYLKETIWLAPSEKGPLDITNGVDQDPPLHDIDPILTLICIKTLYYIVVRVHLRTSMDRLS